MTDPQESREPRIYLLLLPVGPKGYQAVVPFSAFATEEEAEYALHCHGKPPGAKVYSVDAIGTLVDKLSPGFDEPSLMPPSGWREKFNA